LSLAEVLAAAALAILAVVVARVVYFMALTQYQTNRHFL
jgi:hypothetical protein